jgi:hypothetical protein
VGVGKTVNFATIYGQGATALGQQLGLTRNEAKKIDYFELYAGIRTWLDQTVAAAHQRSYVTTILGRKLHPRAVQQQLQRPRPPRAYRCQHPHFISSVKSYCVLALPLMHWPNGLMSSCAGIFLRLIPT